MSMSMGANIVLFLMAAAPLSIGLSGIDRYPNTLGDKLEFYRQRNTEFDTLIIGSSYVYTGIDPRLLDETLRQAGIESTTFNLGFHSLMAHEIDEVIRLALEADRTQRLKRIIIDLRPSRSEVHRPFRGNKMETWWHSTFQTRSVLSSVWKNPISLMEKLRLTVFHLRLYATNHVPRGTGLTLFQKFTGTYENDWRLSVLPETRGYDPLSADELVGRILKGRDLWLWGGLLRNSEMMKNRKRFEIRLARVAEEAHKIASLEHENVEIWQHRAQTLRDRGILAVHVLMPAYDNPFTAEANALALQGTLDYYVSFNDPERYPELFELDHRFDSGHLNVTGTQLLTKRLGEELAALIKGEPSLIGHTPDAAS